MIMKIWMITRKKKGRKYQKLHWYILILFLFGGFGFIKSSEQLEIDSHLGYIEKELRECQEIAFFDHERSILRKQIVNLMRRKARHLDKDQIEQLSYLIYDLSKIYKNLEIELICATITQESGWQPDAISKKGAIGLMQILPSTGAWLAKLEGIDSFAMIDLFDPVINVKLGCRYLSMLIDRYEDVSLALAHYNGGSSQARYYASGDSLISEETRRYVPAVLAQMLCDREDYNLDNYK